MYLSIKLSSLCLQCALSKFTPYISICLHGATSVHYAKFSILTFRLSFQPSLHPIFSSIFAFLEKLNCKHASIKISCTLNKFGIWHYYCNDWVHFMESSSTIFWSDVNVQWNCDNYFWSYLC